jgi:hypothetical protein
MSGGPRAAMTETLIGKNFAPGLARGVVEAFMSAHADGRPQPENCVRLDMDAPPYVYETPRNGGTNLSHPFAIIRDLLDKLIVDNKSTSKSGSLSAYLVRLARLGGYLARATDPPPGNTVIWRGMSRLTDIEIGFQLGAQHVGN